MITISITVDDVAAQTLLNQLQMRMDNMQPVLNTVGHTIKENIRLTFRDLKTPDGVPWKPLSPVTKFNRAKRIAGGVYIKSGKRTTNKFTNAYLTANPLNDTGALRDSIAYQLSGDMVEIGTNLPYAAMMNFGGKKAEFRHLWGDIPAREFIPTEHLPIKWEQDVIQAVKIQIGIA